MIYSNTIYRLPRHDRGAQCFLLGTLGDMETDSLPDAWHFLPNIIQLTLADNRFESWPPFGDGGAGSVDTFIWNMTDTARATIADNTFSSNAVRVPTIAVLECNAFSITGNVIGNRRGEGDPNSLSLYIQPNITQKDSIKMLTVTGNTMFSPTNLGEFPRAEWTRRLPKEFEQILTWEFFNTIA